MNLKDLTLEEKKILASDVDTDSAILVELAKDPSAVIRWRVAYNRSTPLDTLKILCNDHNIAVSDWAKKNPNYTKLNANYVHPKSQYSKVNKYKKNKKTKTAF